MGKVEVEGSSHCLRAEHVRSLEQTAAMQDLHAGNLLPTARHRAFSASCPESTAGMGFVLASAVALGTTCRPLCSGNSTYLGADVPKTVEQVCSVREMLIKYVL
jgi:hypothetical protein